MKKNERLMALNALLTVTRDKIPLKHSTRDFTPFAKALCFGVCRYYFALEKLGLPLLNKKPKDEDIWLVILMGLFQLKYMNTAEYAAVTETVKLLDKIKKSWAKSLVNAVLRRFCREQQSLENDLTTVNHPIWLVNRIQQDWPVDWQNILQSNDIHPPMSLRVNLKQLSREDYLKLLYTHEIEASAHPLVTCGIVLKDPCDVSLLPGFSTGMVSIQDIAPQLTVSFLNLQPHLRLLDACAAPGGKTCHLLETEKDLYCIALDVDERRLTRMKENFNRLNVEAVLCQGDAMEPEAWWDGQVFDRILLDAPCSATGVIRRHPDIKLLRTDEEIAHVAGIQSRMLDALWPLLAKNGLMLYATCSIIKQENELQIQNFLQRTPDCQLLTLTSGVGIDTGFGLQILPGQQQCDGFFYSLLRKI